MNLAEMLGAAGGYLREHPDELVRVARNAIARRVGVPLDALRWVAGELKRGPRDVELTAVPPGLRAAATINLMGNTVRASAVVYVQSIESTAESLRVDLRLEDVALELIEAVADSPVAMLLQSGALDLSRPGNLAAHIPKRPAMLVEAKDDRVVIDLMKHPRVANSQRMQRAIHVATSLVTVGAIETDWEHLDVLLQPFPAGLPNVLAAVRSAL
jgi:hypothetical protein